MHRSIPAPLTTLSVWTVAAALLLPLRAAPAADFVDLFSAATPVNKLIVAKDFKVELLYSVPKGEQGSWVALTFDPKGRLIVSDQYGKLYRIQLPALNSTAGLVIEPIDLQIGQAQGLLCAFDSLYVMVATKAFDGMGLYRVRDTNNDDRYDEVKLLRGLGGGGEHGPHAILLSPDKKSLHIISGNQTPIPEMTKSRVPRIWGEDHLLPRLWDGNGFMKGVLGPGGWIAKTDPEGKESELLTVGFRNEYDAAFNRHGELFTFDADMEWDLNTPWYRPTRVNMAVSGAEFGWRSGAGKWPDYYPDSLPAVVNIGPGSPTGVAFGYGAKFPAKYQEAFYICDWSYGKLYAVHLTPRGSTYHAAVEEFVTGQPLPLTDLAVHPTDGALYFTIGGRRTQSGLYRVTYSGRESTAPSKGDSRGARERELRHKLEALHGGANPKALDQAWPYLKHEDRYIRHAARVALEFQDPATWRDRALSESNPQTAIQALIALSRSSSRDAAHRAANSPPPSAELQTKIIAALDRIAWKKLELSSKLDLLRAYSLACTRFGRPSPAIIQGMTRKFEPLFPSDSREMNTELAAMLVYLQAPTAATKLVSALREAPTQEEQLEYARSLRILNVGWTPALREQYFSWFNQAVHFRGGASLSGFLRDINADALKTVTEAEKKQLAPILEAKPKRKAPLELLAERPFLKEWSIAELSAIADKRLDSGRSFERGRQLFGAAACAACHRFDNEGAAVGPDLTGVAGRFNSRDLLESISIPSKEISDQYGAIIIRKKNGDTVSGRVANMDGDTLNIAENMNAPGDFTNVQRKDIESIEYSKVSMMPEGMLNTMREEEIADLLAYLLSGGDRRHKMFKH